MYVYSDEDNNPMIDEAWQAERERAEQKRKERLSGVLDMLGVYGECRNCAEVCELAQGYLDRTGQISAEQFHFLKMQCSACGGMGTGKPKDEKHEKWRDNCWNDLLEWVKLNELKFRCAWCPNVYMVYGQYKDPDDEWKALEDLCCNCKYFGEE
jgi:hypothetical protein